ncbi:MAG: hypothetical protein ABI306_11635 [Caulobacteraceae bacterium]
MTAPPIASLSPPAAATAIRALIAAGEVAAARSAFEAMRARLAPFDLALTQCLLQEGEGDLEAALASLEQALVSYPRAIHLHAQSARLLARMERPVEAEAAALATLALDKANVHALTALAFVYARTGRDGESLDVVHRLATRPGSSEAAVWSAVAELAGAGRWADILRVLDERGSALEGRRVRARRAEALLELGRQTDALAVLAGAHRAGDAPPLETINRLIARGALAVAARLIEESMAGEPKVADLTATLARAAESVRDASSSEAAPLAFADAAHALAILFPYRPVHGEAVARAADFLVERARARQARGDPSGATDDLVVAARLAPADRAVLEMLAEAAGRAGRPDQRLDALLRLHDAHPAADTLVAAVEGALGASRWDAVAKLMSRASDQGLDAAPEVSEAADRWRARLHVRLEVFVRERDLVGGLEMLAGLAPWMTLSDWPAASISRPLLASKRYLRGQRVSADAEAFLRVSSLYLALDPDDADVGRLVGRFHLRHRRFAEAARALATVVRADPHVAGDWLDLAQARGELGELMARDACLARALVIAPASLAAGPLDQFWARMARA